MKSLFDDVSYLCSRLTTQAYSTSFSIGIYCLARPLRNHIYSIYGFVRFADEIVDTFHQFPKAELLRRFKEDTHRAIAEGISLNPILNSFQQTVTKYGIELEVIDQFLNSMEMDLYSKSYSQPKFEEYILGSAEVVGLMCLRVFCQGNPAEYERLRPFAMKLGSAFQKVNFLRDLRDDYAGMGRMYFPNLKPGQFDESTKSAIEHDIHNDFVMAEEGIRKLPRQSRWGVYVAYLYYRALFNKIRNTSAEQVMGARIRVRNRLKLGILAVAFVRHQMNLI